MILQPLVACNVVPLAQCARLRLSLHHILKNSQEALEIFRCSFFSGDAQRIEFVIVRIDMVASQGDDAASPVIPGDATWDNFLATTAEPRLTVSVSGGSVVLNWPFIPYRLQSSPSLSSPVWTDVTTGITLSSGHYVYSAPATDSGYFRLSYP